MDLFLETLLAIATWDERIEFHWTKDIDPSI